jgi:hypothetical protein
MILTMKMKAHGYVADVQPAMMKPAVCVIRAATIDVRTVRNTEIPV